MANFWSPGIPLGYTVDRIDGPTPSLDKQLRYSDDRHITVIGPNGVGKTMRVVIPAIAELTGYSLLIVDIKGSICAMTEAHRRAAGNVVIKLNPFHVLNIPSDGFNPVQTLDPALDSFPDDALELAESIIRVDNTREPHWPQAAQEVIAALIMYVRLVIPNGTLYDVRRLLSRTDEEWRTLVNAPADVDPQKLSLWERQSKEERDPKYFPPVKHNGGLFPGMIAASIINDCPEIEHKIARFGAITPENREMHSVLSTALVQTRWIDSREIARDFRGPGIDFGILKERPTTIYLMLPPRRLRTHSSWLRLCIASAVQKLMRDTRRARVPVMMIMDEYYALAEPDNFPVISKNYAMFREYGIKIMQVWQSLTQMQELNQHGYEAFIGNAGVIMCFSPQDATTSEYFSRLAGQTTRHFLSESESLNPNPLMPQGAQVSHSYQEHYIPFPLLRPEEIRSIGVGYSLCFSHTWKGAMRVYTPWPGDVRHLRGIMRLNPNN